jgi:hypothetical protein
MWLFIPAFPSPLIALLVNCAGWFALLCFAGRNVILPIYPAERKFIW